MKRSIIIVFFLIKVMSVYSQKPIYLPLGDSYTICEGLQASERWPNLLQARMEIKKMPFDLLSNPSRTGFTTQDLIKNEMGYFYKIKPDFVTILIGVNDYVQGYDTADFHSNLIYILNEVQAGLKVKTNVILITIPDYSVTPAGKYYARGRDVSKDLQIWNAIIKKEGSDRKLPVVDIFPMSQKMKDDPTLVCPDNLHPSAKEVKLWADLIEPEFINLVKAYY